MKHIDIVKKLIGPITPIGETNEDNIRFENLKEMCELVDLLVVGIDEVAYKYKDSHQFSIIRASDYASNFIDNKLGIV